MLYDLAISSYAILRFKACIIETVILFYSQ